MLAEDRIKKLARQGSNTSCPNCGTEKKFGFGSVCMLSLAFVCNECKSSHQAISHRCKSLTMSAWTDAEVLQIIKAGANDGCRRTWLAKAPPIGQGGRPRPGDDISVYKRFIEAAYDRKLYYSNDDEADEDEPSGEQYRPQQQQRSQPAAAVSAPVVAAPAPVATADLLDFKAFESFSSPVPAAASATDFWSTPATVPAPSPAPSTFASAGHDSFGDFASASRNSAPSPAAGTVQHDPFAGFASSSNNNNNNNHFGTTNDLSKNFALAPSAAAPATKKPIMQGSANSANLISAMGSSHGASMGMPMQQQNMMTGMSHPSYQQQQQQMMAMMSMMNHNNINNINDNNGSMSMMNMSQQPMGGLNNMNMMGTMPMHGGIMQQQYQNMNGVAMTMPYQQPQHQQFGCGMPQQQKSLTSVQQQKSSKQPQQPTKPDPFANLF